MAEILPVAKLDASAFRIVSTLCHKIAPAGLGVTHHGTHLTFSWYEDGAFVSVTLLVESVDDGSDDDDVEDK